MTIKNNKKNSIVEKMKKVIVEFNKEKIEIEFPKETEVLSMATPKPPFSCFLNPRSKRIFFPRLKRNQQFRKI